MWYSDPSGSGTTYRGRGRVLRVKEGYNPNSSSLGSVVFTIPAALLAAPVLLAGVAAWIARRFADADASPETPPAADNGAHTEGKT